MKSAIIIGASSGIGRALAANLAGQGYRLGLVARRTDLLNSLKTELATPSVTKAADVSQTDVAIPLLRELIAELGEVDLFVISAGTGSDNAALDWEPEHATIGVNVVGFAAMVNVAVAHLEKRRAGHLVGISSLAALRGIGGAPAYAASKAFVSNYLQGIRYRFKKLRLPVVVTEVQPGFVETRMSNPDHRFWSASAEVAASQIADAIRRKKEHVYVTRRWRLVAWLVKAMPDGVYWRLGR
jgi:short-subunit dehydrogenase